MPEEPHTPETHSTRLPAAHGSVLLRRLQNYINTDQRHRAWELLESATAEIDRLLRLCENVHDQSLRGAVGNDLRALLREGWQGPNS
jgi:hypothetical protein